jgi:mRNA export factor
MPLDPTHPSWESTPLIITIIYVQTLKDLAFHPQHGTFATAGSDGKFVFWDKDRRERLKHFTNLQP